MKKIVDIFKKIKQGLKNPKTKSLTLLGIYALFFIFVFVVLNFSSSKETNVVDKVIKEKEENTITSYEYIYTINNNNVLSEITGTYSNGKEVFNYNNKKYYIKDSKVYLSDNDSVEITEELPLNIISYNYNNINKLIESSEFIEKTTYKDNSEKTTYNITSDKYFEILKSNISNVSNYAISNISIIVKSSKYVDEVLIDLSSYFGYVNTIEISFSNINNIEKISTLSE